MAVLVLGSIGLTANGHSCGQVANGHGRFGLVAMLAAWS
jgi:hypothetical protein